MLRGDLELTEEDKLDISFNVIWLAKGLML